MLNQNVDVIEDTVLRSLKHYENYPSIKEIERNVERRNFSFSSATFTDIEQQLKNLNPKKASQDTDIPTRILKENSELLFKRDSRNKVQNYRPVSILSNLSKVYEKCLFNEMTTHFDDILIKYRRGFRKGFSSQQCLTVLVKKWQEN